MNSASDRIEAPLAEPRPASLDWRGMSGASKPADFAPVSKAAPVHPEPADFAPVSKAAPVHPEPVEGPAFHRMTNVNSRSSGASTALGVNGFVVAGANSNQRSEPVEPRRRFARSRRNQRGLTLIEISIAIAIIGVLLSGTVMSIGALTGSKAKAATGELGGVIRSLYDTAALSGKTCRLVFELPPARSEEGRAKYWAECAAGSVTTSRDRDALLREEGQREKARDDDRRLEGSTSGEPTLQELMSAEKDRVESEAKYSQYTNPEIQPRDLPSGVKVSVWTRHQKEAVSSGVAYLYFFPQGMTERAMVFVEQGDNAWTLKVAPLTGKTSVVSEKLEVPRS
jgi:general secretion pathway protein H